MEMVVWLWAVSEGQSSTGQGKSAAVGCFEVLREGAPPVVPVTHSTETLEGQVQGSGKMRLWRP